jgi:hypothetical protein
MRFSFSFSCCCNLGSSSGTIWNFTFGSYRLSASTPNAFLTCVIPAPITGIFAAHFAACPAGSAYIR